MRSRRSIFRAISHQQAEILPEIYKAHLESVAPHFVCFCDWSVLPGIWINISGSKERSISAPHAVFPYRHIETMLSCDSRHSTKEVLHPIRVRRGGYFQIFCQLFAGGWGVPRLSHLICSDVDDSQRLNIGVKPLHLRYNVIYESVRGA